MPKSLIDCLDLLPKKESTHFSESHRSALMDRYKLYVDEGKHTTKEASILALQWAIDKNVSSHNEVFGIPKVEAPAQESKTTTASVDDLALRKPGDITVEEMMAVPTADSMRLFNEIRKKGTPTQHDGVLAGMKLSESDVPRLIELKDKTNSDAMKLAESGGDAAINDMSALINGKVAWLNGVIEGANKKGPNYDVAQGILKSQVAKATTPESIGLTLQSGANGKKGYYNITAAGIQDGVVHIDGDTMHLINIRASEAGKKSGGAFVEKLKAFADSTGKKISLISKADSPELQSKLDGFYQKLGFKLVNKQSNEYQYGKEVVAAKESTTTGLINGETRSLTAGDVAVDSRGTFDESKRGKKNASATVWPAWFRPTGMEARVALIEKLLSDRGTPGESGKQKTKRLTVLLDNQTGKVHIVSTYESAPGKPAVTLFSEELRQSGAGQKKSAKSTPLDLVLDAKMPDGKPRFDVIGSMRTKELTEFFHQEIPSHSEFENQIGQKLDIDVANVQKLASLIEEQAAELKKEKPSKPGKKKGDQSEDNFEPDDEPVVASGTVQDVHFNEAPHIDLTPEQATLLASLPVFHSKKELTDLFSDGKVSVEQMALLAEIQNGKKKGKTNLGQDPMILFRLMDDADIKKTLENYDKANGGRTSYAKLVRSGEQSSDSTATVPVSDAKGLSEPGAAGSTPTVASEQGGAGKPESTGDVGNKKPDQASGALKSNLAKKYARIAEAFDSQGRPEDANLARWYSTAYEAKYKLQGKDLPEDGDPRGIGGIDDLNTAPTGWDSVDTGNDEPLDPEHERIIDHIYKAAAAAGIDVRLIKSDRSHGLYSVKGKLLTQWVGKVIGAVDVNVAVHEVAHHVSQSLPVEVRNQVITAIMRMTDAELGIGLHADYRISEKNPTGLSPYVLQEERLVGATELSLKRQGFNPIDANTYAQSFVRAMKDVALKSAMLVQRFLGLEPSNRLALAYFENSVKRLLAGDHSRFSFMDMFGLAKPTVAGQYHKWFNTATMSGEYLTKDGITYSYVDGTSPEGMRFNADQSLNTIPVTENPKISRTITVEREIAALNHLIELQEKSAEAIAKSEHVKKSGKTAMEWIRSKLSRLGNPLLEKDSFNGRLDFDQQPIEFNPDVKLEDFKGESNRDRVALRMYKDTQSMAYKLDQAIRERESKIKALSEKREKATESISNARKRYADLDVQSVSLNGKVISRLNEFLLFSSGSKSRSTIAAQLKLLDTVVPPKAYGKEFESMAASKVITGKRLLEVLDSAANTPSVDFKLKANVIRDAMKESGKFSALTQASQRSRAMLATVIAIAKENPRLMAELELRRMKDGKAEVEAKLDGLIAGKVKPTKSSRIFSRADPISDRILQEYSKEARKLRASEKDEATNKADLAALKLIEPVISKRMDELTGLLGVVGDFHFQDGAEYHRVKKGMSTEDVLKAKAKVVIDTSSGEITNSKQIEADVLDMKEFLLDREEKFKSGDLSAKDRAYQRVERQYQVLAQNLNYKLDGVASDRTMFELSVMPEFSAIGDAFNTPAAQLFKRVGNTFARIEAYLRNISDGAYDKGYRMRREIAKMLPGLGDDNLQTLIDSAKDEIEQNTSDLVEIYSDKPDKLKRVVYNRVRENLLNTRLAKDINLASVMDRFMPVFERLIDHEWEAGEKFKEAVIKGSEVQNPVTGGYDPAGLKVKDQGVKVIDDDGNLVSGNRRHVAKGWRTFGGRKMNNGFNQMAGAMKRSGWLTFKDQTGGDKLSELYREDPEAARELLNKFFNNKQDGQIVREWFLKMLASRSSESSFDAPALEDGVTNPPADPDVVIRAFDAAPEGDVMSFIENLYDMHDGQSDMAEYIQRIANQLSEHWDSVESINDKYFPDDGRSNPMSDLIGMSPNALIDAREIEGLPSQWFSFHKFDKPNLHKLSRLVAAEVSFGRESKYLAGLMDTIDSEVKAAIVKLEAERSRVRAENPLWKDKKIEKVVEKMANYDQLKKFEDRAVLIPKAVKGLSEFFRKDNSIEATLAGVMRLAQLFSKQMVNNPSSAIMAQATMFDPLFRYGPTPSALKATAAGIKRNIVESVNSLTQAIGIKMFRDGEFSRRYQKLGLQQSERMKKFGDEFGKWDNESAVSHAARVIEEVASFPVGKEDSSSIKFRPTALFDWVTMIADRSLTDGMWTLAGDFVSRGVEHYKKNPDAASDPNFKLSNSDLGIGKGDSSTLEQLKVDMQNFGMDFDSIVKGAVKRGDGTLFTSEEEMRLNYLAMFLISSQSNVSTMNTSAWNNTVIRAALPLLGWAMRRTLDVSGKRLSPDGKAQMSALAKGMTGLAVASLGGLALSAIIDKYYEEILDKKRNLRPMTSGLGLLEHISRVGSTGFFGELANTAVTASSGGDNRIISADRRVIALSSFTGMTSALMNWYNQGEFDYVRVGRPFLSAMGGGAALQYLGMYNNMASADNFESRVNARINAQNYLRVIGRELDLSVRGFSGGSGSPTAMTPYITRMEMAAYANNAADFRSAYVEAIKKAKDEGFEDPIDHVKRAFSSKNPLRVVFQSPPSEKEYNRILLALPEQGREAVSSAVNQLNRYAESIGAKGFEGKSEKKKTSADRVKSFREAVFR